MLSECIDYAYTETEGYGLKDGTKQAAMTTLESCITYCTNTMSCTGFQYISNNQCWTSTNANYVIYQYNSHDSTTSSIYKKGPCPCKTSLYRILVYYFNMILVEVGKNGLCAVLVAYHIKMLST